MSMARRVCKARESSSPILSSENRNPVINTIGPLFQGHVADNSVLPQMRGIAPGRLGVLPKVRCFGLDSNITRPKFAANRLARDEAPNARSEKG